ncbi:MAG TPA: hypothetical protein VJ461_06100 [Candidatus Nanoarchaeia archaeon]|nr:hypothetical protein [Candidatus Nanoarchaeia archaeon]
MDNRILIGIALISALFIITGCSTKTVKEIKSEEYIGKDIAIAGTVGATVKIGSLSGFTLTDKNGDTIGVKSDSLPKEGSKITVRGVLVKDTIFGYYIQSKE